MDSRQDGREPLQAREADVRLSARVRRVSFLWWTAACVFSCLLNFLMEAARDWPGDIVNYVAGSAAGAAWSQFLVWGLQRWRHAGRTETFWMGLGLAVLGGGLSGLVAGLASWPVIVGLRLEQIVSYQIGFDLEHYTALSVAWYFIYLIQVSVDRRVRIEENVTRLRILVFKAEDAAIREQVRPERLGEYFSCLSVALAQRLQKEAEDLVLTLSDSLRATLSSRVPRAPGEDGHAFMDAEGAYGVELGGVQHVGPVPGAKFTTRFHFVNAVFWSSIFLLLFVTLSPTYFHSSYFAKMYVLSIWAAFCIVGYAFCSAFTCLWRVFRIDGSLFKRCLILTIVNIMAAFVSACIVSAAVKVYWEHIAPGANLIAICAGYYFAFYVVWHCIYGYAQAIRREVTQRAVLAQAAEAAAAARNSMLRYQVRPHFLFNALNALYALIADRRWAAARAMTEALSAYIEQSFAEDERELVPIREQAKALQTYFSIERVRFGDRLRVRVDIPEQLAHACAPSLILHPLVENAMKYAVASTTEPVDVEIAADCVGDTLLLRVRDSGGDPEAPAAPGLGIGLRNVAARLAGHYGERGLLQCTRLAPKGFVAEVRLPLEYARTHFAA